MHHDAMIGRLDSLVIDCPEPRELADFYIELLGMYLVSEDPDWVTLRTDSPGAAGLCFQRAENFEPPQWPDPSRPQQFHLDVRVEDFDAAEERVLAAGARRLPGEGKDFRVYADPVGHPFCLVR
jgi:catechol 2,3-dioxygenase-like lactoylglutathione lyase family enzyme